MCDYSLRHCKSRPAVVADELISGGIQDGYTGTESSTNGFHTVAEPDVAVCLRPGTELSFAEPVRHWDDAQYAPEMETSTFSTAIFREVDKEVQYTHHDALEFPDGTWVLVTKLVEGQMVRVLQLPTAKQVAAEPPKATELPQAHSVEDESGYIGFEPVW